MWTKKGRFKKLIFIKCERQLLDNFCGGSGRRVGGEGVPFCFFAYFVCFTESSVIFLCARFCLNHVQMVLKKKKEMCASVLWPELRCVTVSALPPLES